MSGLHGKQIYTFSTVSRIFYEFHCFRGNSISAYINVYLFTNQTKYSPINSSLALSYSQKNRYIAGNSHLAMTSKDYRDFAVEQMGLLEGISARPMMGEFLLYWQGKHFGGLYDNRLLVKKTKTNQRFVMPEAIPYDGAKAMYQANIDNRDEVADVIKATCEGL